MKHLSSLALAAFAATLILSLALAAEQRMEGQPAQSRGRKDLFGGDHARRRRWAQPERVRARSLLPGGDLAQSAVTQSDHRRRVLPTKRDPDIACDGVGGQRI